MKQLQRFTAVVFLLVLLAYFVPSAQAIIILPALVLVPVAKILAVVLSAFAFPVLGIGVLWSKFFNTPLRKVMIGVFLGLLFLALFLSIYLKMVTPERPLI